MSLIFEKLAFPNEPDVVCLHSYRWEITVEPVVIAEMIEPSQPPVYLTLSITSFESNSFVIPLNIIFKSDLSANCLSGGPNKRKII